jgi:hypothetical protein
MIARIAKKAAKKENSANAAAARKQQRQQDTADRQQEKARRAAPSEPAALRAHLVAGGEFTEAAHRRLEVVVADRQHRVDGLH